MTRYIIKRIFQIILVLFLSSIIIFVVVRLAPGDPAIRQLGVRAGDPALEETLQNLRKEMGLDKPIVIQYGIWVKKVMKLDFGVSARNNIPVINIIKEKLPASLELILVGILFGVIFSLIFGISSGFKANSLWDRIVQLISQAGLAVPVFWIALLLMIVFSLKFKILPISGYVSFLTNPIENLKHIIMPSLSFGIYEVAVFTRYLRSETIEVLNQDYIKVARSKGLPSKIILSRHALKNILIPFVTALGLEIGALIGNTAIIEQMFGWPGIGWLLFNAIYNRDYALIQGIIILIAFGFSVINLIVDILYAYLNPRIIYTRIE